MEAWNLEQLLNILVFLEFHFFNCLKCLSHCITSIALFAFLYQSFFPPSSVGSSHESLEKLFKKPINSRDKRTGLQKDSEQGYIGASIRCINIFFSMVPFCWYLVPFCWYLVAPRCGFYCRIHNGLARARMSHRCNIETRYLQHRKYIGAILKICKRKKTN